MLTSVSLANAELLTKNTKLQLIMPQHLSSFELGEIFDAHATQGDLESLSVIGAILDRNAAIRLARCINECQKLRFVNISAIQAPFGAYSVLLNSLGNHQAVEWVILRDCLIGLESKASLIKLITQSPTLRYLDLSCSFGESFLNDEDIQNAIASSSSLTQVNDSEKLPMYIKSHLASNKNREHAWDQIARGLEDLRSHPDWPPILVSIRKTVIFSKIREFETYSHDPQRLAQVKQECEQLTKERGQVFPKS